MSEQAMVVRGNADGARRWFLGGGVHVWKLTGADTNGELFLFEDHLEEGKVTPLHRHPDASETIILLEGTIVAHVNGELHEVREGSVAYFPKGLPHAFRVTSKTARLLCIQTPGAGESFYRAASEPGESGEVNFRRLGELARESGAIEILGPPPFARVS